MNDESRYLQELIIAELGVSASFDVGRESELRVEFLADRLRRTRADGYVLAISGGVDSAVGGRLAQLAVERIRSEGDHATFVAMRLPYGVQADEGDAQTALAFIRPDETVAVNVKPSSDALVEEARHAGLGNCDDFHLGNVKARQRMVAQYLVAGARGLLVIGTDHAAEAVMGFFTKYGDGASDLAPLSGLNKRRVRAIGERLGAGTEITGKVPTADLETHNPGIPDEAALGVSYDEIDDFLEGRDVDEHAASAIIAAHRRTAHKRAMPLAAPATP